MEHIRREPEESADGARAARAVPVRATNPRPVHEHEHARGPRGRGWGHDNEGAGDACVQPAARVGRAVHGDAAADGDVWAEWGAGRERAGGEDVGRAAGDYDEDHDGEVFERVEGGASAVDDEEPGVTIVW